VLNTFKQGVASSVGFSAFQKIKYIFSIAPVESLGSHGSIFYWKNTHRTLTPQASDVGPAFDVCWLFFACFQWVIDVSDTLAPDAVGTLFERLL
jgi:hypothetical protein